MIAMYHGAYGTIDNLDSPMHFVGGMSIAGSAYYFLVWTKQEKLLHVNHKFIEFIFIVGLVAISAICWEYYEFISDTFGGTRMQISSFDTVKDLFLGTLGGSLVAGVILMFTKPKR